MKNVWRILMGIGILVLIGTAGADDAGRVATYEMLISISGACVLIAIGYVGLKVAPYKGAGKRKKNRTYQTAA